MMEAQDMRVLVTGSSGFIGSALTESLLHLNVPQMGIDICEPRYKHHFPFWRRIDILDKKALRSVVLPFAPTHVVHLAARTDLGLDETIEDFRANTDGVRNVVEICKETSSIQMAMFASTILVCRAGYVPITDDDYCPNTPYGASKVEGEKILRNAAKDIPFTWFIARPTSIWGPGYGSHYVNFFKTIANGWYFHPGKAENRVVYGYLGNCVYQIERLVEADPEAVQGKVFYLGDYWSTRLSDWANLIQRELGHGRLTVLPDSLVRIAAICGDILWRLGWKRVPLTTFRLKNMTIDRLYDTSLTEAVVGRLPYTQEQGVKETLSWLRANNAI